MRKIKFRAWDEDQFMFIPTKIEFNKMAPNDTWVWYGDIYGQLGSAVVALMQYTGLKDKNGVEIYEGDIVKTKWLEGELKQDEYIEKIPYLNNFHWFNELDDMEVEIIGNIYENPELLK